MFITGIFVTLAVIVLIGTAWLVIYHLGEINGNTGGTDPFAWFVAVLLIVSTFYLGAMTERHLIADTQPQKQEVKK